MSGVFKQSGAARDLVFAATYKKRFLGFASK
jgi:hypothetical protein